MRSNIAATLAVFAIAPLVDTSGSLRTSYVTEYYDDCPYSNATATGTITSTYCSSCTKKPSSFGNTTIARITTLTTYTTVYLDIFPTGTIFKTYTITEPYSSLNQPRPTNYVPQGFVITTIDCHICAETSIPIVLTTPISTSPGPGGAPGGNPAKAAGVPGSPGAPGAPGTPGNPRNPGNLDIIGPGETIPAAASPSITAPGVSSPGAAIPGAGSLGAGIQGAGSPGAAIPGTGSSGVAIPGAGSPGATSPIPTALSATTPGAAAPGAAYPPGVFPAPGSNGGLPNSDGSSSGDFKNPPAVSVAPSIPLLPTSQVLNGVQPTEKVNPSATNITPFTGTASTLSLELSILVGFMAMMGSLFWIL